MRMTRQEREALTAILLLFALGLAVWWLF